MRELMILTLAALLECGGDAVVRLGLKHGRLWGFVLGAAILFLYGVTVNAPDWNFGRLLGVYIAVFFVASQILAFAIYHEKMKPPMLIGGALIIAGGLVMAFWRGKGVGG